MKAEFKYIPNDEGEFVVELVSEDESDKVLMEILAGRSHEGDGFNLIPTRGPDGDLKALSLTRVRRA